MASAESDNNEENSGLDLISKAKETAMNSCNSVTNSLGCSHLLSLCISPLIHAVDIGSDANLAYRYYEDGEYLYCGLTAFFIAVPTILVSLLQKMYFQNFSPGSILKWIYEMVMMILPISPFLSSFQAFNNVRFLKRTVTDFAENPDLDKFDVFQKRFDSLTQEKSSAATLGVAQGFLKSAPQLVLQITILLTRAQLTGSIHLYLSLGSSFASTMKAFVGFYNSVQKNKTTRIGTVLLYLWSTLIITSRVMAISLGLCVHPVETTATLIIHWTAMTGWLSFLENTQYCQPAKPGKLGKLFAKVPLEQLKLGTLTNVGAQVKDEALAKVGALTSLFTRNEVKNRDEENEASGQMVPQAEEEAQAEEETQGGTSETQNKEGAKEADVEAAQEGEKGKENDKSVRVTFKKIFFSAIFGMIYIFVYVSIVEKPTRNKYAFYYFVWFLENCFFLVIGLRELWQDGAWFSLGLRAVTFGGVAFSLVIMFFYIVFYNQRLWPKKLDGVSGGFGLETAYQYGLNGLKAIDPTQLIPLKSIDPSQFIPKLDSLQNALPGAELISGLVSDKLPDSLPGAQLISNLIPGKEMSLPDAIPGGKLVSGLFSGGEGSPADIVPGAQLISNLIPGKEVSLPDAIPGGKFVSGLFSRGEESPADTVPGAQLISNLIPGKEVSLPDAIPGGKLVSGLFSGKEENPADTVPGAQLITNLISKQEDTSPSIVPGAQLVTGLLSEKAEALPGTKFFSKLVSKKDNDNDEEESSSGNVPEAETINGLVSDTTENLSKVIPGAQLVSGLFPGKEASLSNTVPESGSIDELISANEESLPSVASGTEFVSGLIAGNKEESLPSAVPGAQLVSGLLSGKKENSSDPAPVTQVLSGLIPGKEEGSFKLWGK